MKRTMIPCSLALVAGVAMALSGFADYDVLLNIEGGNCVERYSVSSDGETWSKGQNFLSSSTPLVFATPGDGYVYVPMGTTIDRYKADGTKVDTWKSGLSGKARVYLSPDHIWFYVANNWNSSANVERYRVSDPTIGGALGLNDASHGSLNGTNNRDITFGRDGVMYLGCRGNNITDPTAANYGVNDMGRGVFAYDVTVSGAPLLKRYPLDGNKTGVAVLIDDDRDRLIANDTSFRYFKLGDAVQYQAAKASPGGGSTFYTFTLGDMKYFGNYTGRVHRYNVDNDTYSTTILSMSDKIAAISDITDVNSGSQLPYVTGVWYMNETDGTQLVNGANPGQMDITLSGSAVTGFCGASRWGVRLRTGGLATVSSSAALVPATGDFTIGLWTKAKEGTVAFSNGSTTLGVDADGKPYVSAGDVTVAGDSSVFGDWHSLMVRRAGDRLELYVDNVMAGQAELPPDTTLAQSGNWTISATTALVDELRVYPKLLTLDDMTLLYDLVRPETGKCGFSDDNAKKLGSVVVHADPLDGDVSAPSAVALGTKVYAAVDGAVFVSDQTGDVWVRKGTVALQSVSLFTDGSALYAVGLDAGNNLSLGRTNDEGASWTVEKIGTGLSVPPLKPTAPLLSNGRVWLGCLSSNGKNILTLSFAFSEGTASDPRFTVKTAGCVNSLSSSIAVAGPNGDVRYYASMINLVANAGETFAVFNMTSEKDVAYSRVLSFPGASKPASIAYDEVTKRYWMVTAACHMKNRVANQAPSSRAYSLALYSSADLEDWYGHGDVTDVSVPAHFRAPALVIAGDDLVVVSQASVEDGVSCARLSGGVFDNVLATRIAGFRKFWTPRISLRAYHAKELLVCEETDQLLSRAYLEESTGDWLPSGILCRGSDVFRDDQGNEVSPGQLITVRSFGENIFAASLTKFGVFEFTKKGEFVRFYPLPSKPDGMTVSLDGTKIYATPWWGNKLYTIDRGSNTCVTKDFGIALSIARGVADLGGGKLAISSRGNQKILIYDTVRDTYETLALFGSDGNGPQDIFYETEKGRLYLTSNSAGSGYYDVKTQKYVRLTANAFHGFARWDDKTLVSTSYGSATSAAGELGSAAVSVEAATWATMQTVRAMTFGGCVNRCWVIENPKPQIGSFLSVR